MTKDYLEVPTGTAESLAELPELPATLKCQPNDYCLAQHHVSLFTAEQMRSYALAAIQMERERCAKLCDKIAANKDQNGAGAEVCAAAIRQSGSR